VALWAVVYLTCSTEREGVAVRHITEVYPQCKKTPKVVDIQEEERGQVTKKRINVCQYADLGTGGYERVQLWSADAKVSGEERRREIHKEYFCVTALEILFDDLVRNI
jgi:hypothetical protein